MVDTLENQQRVFWLLSNVLLKLYLCIILPILLLSADELKSGCGLVCRGVCAHACVFGEGDTTGIERLIYAVFYRHKQ